MEEKDTGKDTGKALTPQEARRIRAFSLLSAVKFIGTFFLNSATIFFLSENIRALTWEE